MGLDWVIQPRPDEQQHEYETVFRGETLRTTNLPDEITRTAYTDMCSWQMQEFAETLDNELAINENKYTDKEQEQIRNAIEWLQYWGDTDKSLYAWY